MYKEPLASVISPTFESVKAAVDDYVARGGAAKVIICDDGLLVVQDEEKVARINFYKEQNIAFVARPAAGRRGVFKKASNLNYTLNLSTQITRRMKQDGHLGYAAALFAAWTASDREFVAHGDLALPDDSIILLIDADTRMPVTALHDVVGEFVDDENLAYTQHYTQPFADQQNNYWEQMISYFVERVYFNIAVSTSIGDCAPLVGHNAFIRWAALQQVAYDEDGHTQYWSEHHVSEDFELLIRLCSINKFGRYVMYTGDGFKEGVSLTYIDELMRLKKFAYGSCELVFNKIADWWGHGITRKQFRSYLYCRQVPWYVKVSLCIYLSMYFAMASALPYVLLEGIVSICRPDVHDKYFIRAFDVMLTCTVLFALVNTLATSLLIYRLEHQPQRGQSFLQILWNEVKWIPYIAFFFSSILFHMTAACFAFLAGRPLQWGATKKEVKEVSLFWLELTHTLRSLRREYAFFAALLLAYGVCMWYFRIGMYHAWGVVAYCTAHLTGPVLFNPVIMSLKH